MKMTMNHVVRPDNAPELRFHGELVAWATSDPDEQKDYWAEMAVYLTQDGQYVAEVMGHTQQEERMAEGYCRAQLCVDVKSLKKYLGHSKLAHRIYDRMGIDYT